MNLKKIKFDGMLIATLLTTIFYSSTYPFIYKEIITVVSQQMIALNQIINCVSIVLFGFLWNKLSDKLFTFYPLYCILEGVFNIALAIFAILTQNLVVYYILDIVIIAIVTRNISCGRIKLRALRYINEDEREHFDNNDNSMYAIACIIGSIIAMFLKLNFNIMICLATFGTIIDNIFYIVIYYKERSKPNKGDNNVKASSET